MQQAQTNLHKCRYADLGSNVLPDNTKMCLVNLDSGARNNLNFFYAWGDLSTAPCALVPSSSAMCGSVGGQGNVVVGVDVARSVFARRRLLSDGTPLPPGANASLGTNFHHRHPPRPLTLTEVRARKIRALQEEAAAYEGWEHVAEPCRSLLGALKASPDAMPMGVLDLQTAQDCLFWRNTARDTMVALNITTLGDHNDHLLMSVTDFVSVASQKGMLRSLVRWDILTHVVKQLPIYAKLAVLWENAMLSAVAVHVEKLFMLHNYTAIAAKAAGLLTKEEREFLHYIDKHQNTTELLLPFMMQSMHGNAPIAALEKKGPPAARRAENSRQSAEEPVPPPPPSQQQQRRYTRGRRKLLQNGEGLDDPIAAFSTLTASMQSFANVPLEDTIAETWLQGPGWPPRFTYWEREDPCVLGQSLVDSAVDAVIVLKEYYTGPVFNKRVAKPPWDLQHNLPKLYNGTPAVDETQQTYTIERQRLQRRVEAENSNDPAVQYFEFFGNGILKNIFGITPESIRNFFTTGKGIPRDCLLYTSPSPRD